MLGTGDSIHISLYHYDLSRITDGLACGKQVIEFATFLKKRRLGRVQVFWFPLVEYTPAETDYRPLEIEYGKHDAVPKAVIAVAFVALDHQASLHQQILSHGLRVIGKGPRKITPFGGGITDAKMEGGLAGEAALFQISDGSTRMPELFTIKTGSSLHYLQQAPRGPHLKVLLPLDLDRRLGLGNLHANTTRQIIHRLDKMHR